MSTNEKQTYKLSLTATGLISCYVKVVTVLHTRDAFGKY